MWVACDAAKLGAFEHGAPLTKGIRNPFDTERLFRVLRADGRLMIELVLPPYTDSDRDVELLSFSGGECVRVSGWVGMYPIRGETLVEVWVED